MSGFTGAAIVPCNKPAPTGNATGAPLFAPMMLLPSETIELGPRAGTETSGPDDTAVLPAMIVFPTSVLPKSTTLLDTERPPPRLADEFKVIVELTIFIFDRSVTPLPTTWATAGVPFTPRTNVNRLPTTSVTRMSSVPIRISNTACFGNAAPFVTNSDVSAALILVFKTEEIVVGVGAWFEIAPPELNAPVVRLPETVLFSSVTVPAPIFTIAPPLNPATLRSSITGVAVALKTPPIRLFSILKSPTLRIAPPLLTAEFFEIVELKIVKLPSLLIAPPSSSD